MFHDSVAPRLLEIAQEHTALAARYGEKDCSLEEKQIIKKRIESLRIERDQLLEQNKELMRA